MCFQHLFVLLVALQVGSNLVEANNNHYDLEDGGKLFTSANIIKIPQSCQGKQFCFEKGDDYPDEMIDTIVENLRYMELEVPKPRIDLGSRSANGATNGEIECKTNFTESPIYYINDTNNQMRVVVQSLHPEHFRQIYSLTWCLEEGPNSDTPHFLKGVKCVTQTMDLDFFVLSENYVTKNPKITVAKAKVPVCCRCQYDAEEVEKQFEQKRLNLMTSGNSLL